MLEFTIFLIDNSRVLCFMALCVLLLFGVLMALWGNDRVK